MWFMIRQASKKVPKPTSLMTFFTLGDSDSHALFNIWRLPWLFRLCNIKIQLINFHNQKHIIKKFPYPKIYSHNQYPTTIKTNHCPTKMSPLPNWSHIHTTTKFFHSYEKKKKKNSTSSCTYKFSHNQNHNHTNFPRINITYPTKFCLCPKN